MAELNHCSVELPAPDKCCVGPCDPPWRPDRECMYWYETKFFRIPLRLQDQANTPRLEAFAAILPYIEFGSSISTGCVCSESNMGRCSIR
jgi:hypothetical protein